VLVFLFLAAIAPGRAEDCNQNGVSDPQDIASGTSLDCNRDAVPDECFLWEDGRDDADRDGIVDHCDPDNPYELRFRGPFDVHTADGVLKADFLVELGNEAPDRSILGLLYGLKAEGCSIEAATTSGTALSGLPAGMAGTRSGTEAPERTQPCIWAGAADWVDPPLFDGKDPSYDLLRFTVVCPRTGDDRCASGSLAFSPACYHTGQAWCQLDLEGESRWPLLTSRSFTICAADFRRGDANADGTVDISDGIRAAMYLFLGAPAPPCLDAADATDDGAIDISDAIRILMDFFIPEDSGIPAPGPFACGPDPTPDAIGCDAPPEC
jgi:hypothetical protein